jgi:hypothetical protein
VGDVGEHSSRGRLEAGLQWGQVGTVFDMGIRSTKGREEEEEEEEEENQEG